MCTVLSNRLSIRVIRFTCVALAGTLPIGLFAQTDPEDAVAREALAAALDGEHLDPNGDPTTTLAAFPLIGPDGAERVLALRRAGRRIVDLNHLAALLDWTDETAALARPYLRFSRPGRPARRRARIQLRATTSSASQADARLMTRTFVRTGTLEAAHVTERDPGERSFADHLSGYLTWFPGRGLSITLGDLRPGIALGAVYARQSRSGTGSPPTGLAGSARLGTVSTEEAGAMRGAAVARRTPRGELLFVAARSSWDATIRDGIAFLRTSGDHASESSRAAVNALVERTILARGRVGANVAAGLTLSRSDFTLPVGLDGSLARTHRHAAVDATLPVLSGRLFLEAAASRLTEPLDASGTALLVGWRSAPAALRVNAAVRRLSPGYRAVRAALPSAYGVANERGISLSATARVGRARFDTLVDRHAAIRRRPGAAVARAGSRTRVSFRHRVTGRVSIEVRLSSRRERDRRAELSDIRTRGARIRLAADGRFAGARLFLEAADGHDARPGRAAATGVDVRLGRESLRLDFWAARSGVTGSGARTYAFRPEVWGGRSVVVLPRNGWAVSGRASVSAGPLASALSVHALPTLRVGVQVVLRTE